MAKKVVILIILFFSIGNSTIYGQYQLHYQFTNNNDSVLITQLKLQQDFPDQDSCHKYINTILSHFSNNGYIAASIDSIAISSASSAVYIYAGERYTWEKLSISPSLKKYLDAIQIPEQYFSSSVNQKKIQAVQEQLLQYLETTGFPFAKVYIDSIQIQHGKLSGNLAVNTGPIFKIDSLEIIGSAKISKEYLERFLDIKPGSIYNQNKIANSSKQLKLLKYIEEKQPPQMAWNRTGGTLQLFIDQKKSSQINVIIGVLPNSQSLIKNKTIITGEANILLENALGNGEKIGFIWQKLQSASQNLNLSFLYPYLLKSPFGLDINFDMVKRDSAFLNINVRLGTEYAYSTQQKLKIFFNQFSTVATAFNKAQVIQTKRLPAEASVQYSSFGLGYHFNNTNYIFNPISGWDINVTFTGGNKTVKKNNQILALQDPNQPGFKFGSLYDTVSLKSFQSKSTFSINKYTELGKSNRVTLKTALNSGFLLGQKFYINELFQIGGNQILRGFNDNSEFLSKYMIGTVEFRYLIGQNSYFNVFSDGGWGNNNNSYSNINYTYISGGLGLAFETKAGIFNIAWAVGKRNDLDFSLKQSKIHFGFASFF